MDVEEVRRRRDEALETWTTPVLFCRDLRHNWDWSGVTMSIAAPGLIERKLSCRTCGTARADQILRLSGEYHGSARYVYPEGYRVSGLGRIPAYEIRREEVARIAPREGDE